MMTIRESVDSLCDHITREHCALQVSSSLAHLANDLQLIADETAHELVPSEQALEYFARRIDEAVTRFTFSMRTVFAAVLVRREEVQDLIGVVQDTISGPCESLKAVYTGLLQHRVARIHDHSVSLETQRVVDALHCICERMPDIVRDISQYSVLAAESARSARVAIHEIVQEIAVN